MIETKRKQKIVLAVNKTTELQRAAMSMAGERHLGVRGYLDKKGLKQKESEEEHKFGHLCIAV